MCKLVFRGDPSSIIPRHAQHFQHFQHFQIYEAFSGGGTGPITRPLPHRAVLSGCAAEANDVRYASEAELATSQTGGTISKMKPTSLRKRVRGRGRRAAPTLWYALVQRIRSRGRRGTRSAAAGAAARPLRRVSQPTQRALLDARRTAISPFALHSKARHTPPPGVAPRRPLRGGGGR